MRYAMDKDSDRYRMIEALAEAHDFESPLRIGTRMTIEKIYGREIDALLASGFEQTGTRAMYEKAEAERARMEQERETLLVAMSTLAATWAPQGFAEHPGKYYAEAIFELVDNPAETLRKLTERPRKTR